MGYISLHSILNVIIGITSYYCVILKMVILHDAIQTIQNGVFLFFFLKNKNLFLFEKPKKHFFQTQKNRWVVFLKPGFFQTLHRSATICEKSEELQKQKEYEVIWQCCPFWCFNIRYDVFREISDVRCFGEKSHVDLLFLFTTFPLVLG